MTIGSMPTLGLKVFFVVCLCVEQEKDGLHISGKITAGLQACDHYFHSKANFASFGTFLFYKYSNATPVANINQSFVCIMQLIKVRAEEAEYI